MSVHLLDVNVLVALMWPAHESHSRVQNWFARNVKFGWATCPFTQAAVVRILSNPAFSRDAVTPMQALRVLGANLKHPQHRFWPDDVDVIQALDALGQKLSGHQHVTDAYLLGLALHRRSKLATMDRSVMALVSDKKPRESIVVIEP